MCPVEGQKKKKIQKTEWAQVSTIQGFNIPLIQMNTNVIITANMSMKPGSLHLECQNLYNVPPYFTCSWLDFLGSCFPLIAKLRSALVRRKHSFGLLLCAISVFNHLHLDHVSVWIGKLHWKNQRLISSLPRHSLACHSFFSSSLLTDLFEFSDFTFCTRDSGVWRVKYILVHVVTPTGYETPQ